MLGWHLRFVKRKGWDGLYVTQAVGLPVRQASMMR